MIDAVNSGISTLSGAAKKEIHLGSWIKATFNKISGTYDDTASTKNFIQITCVGNTEFWYTCSQIG